MPDQPGRVTPADIRDLLDNALSLDRGATLDERIAYHERKARLLSAIAADLGSPQAHLVAADAWHYVRDLATTRGQQNTAEVTPCA